MNQPAPQLLGWRDKPGILGPARLESAVRPRPARLLPARPPLPHALPRPRHAGARRDCSTGALAPPLEKVIEKPRAPAGAACRCPELYRHSVSVIEPWPNVGTNQRGETVRASKNIAYVAAAGRGCRHHPAPGVAQRHPASRAARQHPERRDRDHRAGRQSVGARREQFRRRSTPASTTFSCLVDQLLMRRSTGSGPSIFICLGPPAGRGVARAPDPSAPPRSCSSCRACRWTRAAVRSQR